VVVRNDLLFIARDEIIKKDCLKLFVVEMLLVHMTQEKRNVIPEKSPRPGHKESTVLEMLMIGLQVFCQLCDIFLDNSGLIKTLFRFIGHRIHLSRIIVTIYSTGYRRGNPRSFLPQKRVVIIA
jgi:hypothetical protein